MAKRKSAALLAKSQVEESQKPKVIAKRDSSSEEEDEGEYEYVEEEEEVQEVEEEVEEVEEVEEEEESEEESESEEVEEEEEEEEEEEDEQSKRETLRKLLEPFGKDQIIDFLKEAALKDPSIVYSITQSAESDPVHRKIFIHGLGWDATSEQVLSVFKQYGEIEDCKVVADKVTGRAKGYGFVLFKSRQGALKALKKPQKQIGSRMTSCQLASAGPIPNNQFAESTGRKIYVANVGPHINPDKLRSFFAKFGEIEEGPLGHDLVTGKLKGYALFVYKTAEGCKKALEEPVKMFEGSQLQCRRAVEGSRTSKNQTGVLGKAGAAAAIQQRDINSSVNYGVGVNPGIVGHNLNPAVLVGQNPGIGFANPMLASALSHTVLSPPAATGFSPALGFGGSYGINNISPSMIATYNSQAALQGSYGSQAAFQGLGAYQNTQLGQSSAGSSGGATTDAATRVQSGFGSSVGTTFPSYFAR